MKPLLTLVSLVKRGQKFYQNKRYFRDRKVMLFQRGDVKSNIWNARIRVAGRYKFISLKTEDFAKAKTEALDKFDYLRYRERDNLPVFEKKFHVVADEFLEHGRKRMEAGDVSPFWLSTAKSIIKVWKRYLGDVDITKIPQTKITDYIPWRRENNRFGNKITMEAMRTELSYLRRCLYWAKDQKYVSDIQIPNVQLPKIPKHKKRKRESFDLNDYRRLYRFMRKWVKQAPEEEQEYDRQALRHFILFLANTGLRPGSETKNLQWRDYETREDGHIYVYVAEGKRGSRDAVAQPHLRRAMERWRELCRHTEPEDRIFGHIHSNRRVKQKFLELVNNLFEEAGVRKGRKGTNRTLYSLRHTAITFALRYGDGNIFEIAKNCGTSVQRIEEHYSDILPPDFADSVTSRRKNK